MKPRAPTTSAEKTGKLRHGVPGNAKDRLSRIRAAIAANREMLGRLAK